MILLAALLGLYQLQAEKAKYDGQDLILTDAVEMTHPIGHISARRAIFENFKMDRRTPFQKLVLEGQVCAHATSKGRDLSLFADRAVGDADAGALFAFQQLTCLGNVEITTSDGFTAKGGEARYSSLARRGSAIELFPAPLANFCTLLHLSDRLEARKIRFDIPTAEIVCEEPKGQINAGWKKGSPVSFSARHLSWKQELVLEGSVVLEQAMTVSSEKIRLSFAKERGPLSEIAADGPTSMAFSGKESKIVCQNSLVLDPNNRIVRTDGPLLFQDQRIRLEAGSGRLTYLEASGHPQPDALYCEGSVRLISSIIQNQESFALADELVYFPESRTIILSSRAPNRVLFWQTSGDTTLSAPEVQVRLDPKTKRETVQGIGDVHFRFSLQEENFIETIFSKYL